MSRFTRLMSPLLLGLAACHSAGGHGEAPHVPEGGRVPTVEVLRVDNQPLSGDVHATGTAMAKETADLAPPAGGIATEVLVQVGDEVRSGQALVRYRNERVSLGYRQAEASATAAEAQAAYAESEVARMTPLVERGTIASSQLDSLRTQAQAARSQATAARAAARAAGEAAADLTVRAPFDGIITAVNAQVGETATGATPAVHIADLRTLELTVAVHERDLPGLRNGGTALVHFPNLGLDREGSISWVALELNPRTRSAEVVATLDNNDLSVPSGAFAEVTLRASSDRTGLVLPHAAVGGKDDERFVWVVQDQHASAQSVEIRPLDSQRVEVVSGLQPGQVVVASRTTAVAEGPVRIDGGVL